MAASSFSTGPQGTVEFEDGSKFRGATLMAAPVPASNVVLAGGAAAAGAASPELCAPNALDPATVAGKIVVCDRGVVDRVAKSAEVKRAGGIGMILVNLATSSEDLDRHSVPTVHVNPPATQQIKDKITANPAIKVALVNKDTTGLPIAPPPQIAGFSSRGPLAATGSDMLKPDVAVPGVAGFGALILGKNPGWSPATVKSAMMSTAGEVRNADGTRNGDVFATGAGQVDAARFSAAGEKRTFKVRFENASAALGHFAMGSLVWQGAGKNVASPVAVRPEPVVAPANLAFTSEGGTGQGDFPVVSGTNSPVKITLDGLSKADSSAIELVPGPLALETDDSNFAKEVTVPAGSPLAKVLRLLRG